MHMGAISVSSNSWGVVNVLGMTIGLKHRTVGLIPVMEHGTAEWNNMIPLCSIFKLLYIVDVAIGTSGGFEECIRKGKGS